MKHMLAGASDRTLVLIDEVRLGHGTYDRRGHRRGHPRAAAGQGVLRGDHDPLCQYQVLRLEHRRHRQRRDDLRRAAYPAAFPARDGQAGQFVRRGDRPQDRASGGDHPRGEREGRVGPYQYRETVARDRPRQALLGAETRPHTPDGPQGGGTGADLRRAVGENPRRAAGDSQAGQAGGAAAHRRRQPADREHDPHHPRGTGRKGADAAGAARTGRFPREGGCGRFGGARSRGGPRDRAHRTAAAAARRTEGP